MASTTSNPPPPVLPGLTSHFKPAAAMTITIIITTSVVATLFFLYCRRRRRRRIHRPHLSPSWRSLGRLPTRGLDPEVLASFPSLVYSDVKAHKHPLECAVCLSEFEDLDTLTLLPRCDHAFHPDCIAMWLASHVTCPVCRVVLNGEVGGVKKATAVAEVVVADGPQVAEEEGRAVGGKRWWSNEESERFRLVLPEDVWREVLAGSIGRSVSARGGWEERRRKYLRWDRMARSEHWGTLGRTLSGAWSRHGGGEAVAALVAESSTSSLYRDVTRISTGSTS